MKYAKLGSTDMEVSRVTFGCWELGGGPWTFAGDENNLQAVMTAFDHGITAFDTAEGYGAGHSEEIVGKALKGKRQDCIIATKVSPDHLKAEDVKSSLQGSLRRLDTDYVDLYYIHWPNDKIPIEETMTALNGLKEEGLIRAIGVSNFSLEQLKDALKVGRVDAIQPEYSLLHREIEGGLLQFCRENAVSVMSYSSIAKGILTGAFHLGGHTLDKDDFRRDRRFFQPEHLEKETELIYLLKEIAVSRDATLSQIAISWLLHQEGLTSAIVGTQDERHLIENIQSVDIVLRDEELKRLNQVSEKVIKSL